VNTIDLDLARILENEPLRRIPGRNTTKADLLFYHQSDVPVAIKTYAPRPFWIRHLIGRWLIRRETAAYRAAAGVRGLPAFLGRLDAYSLATEWLDAQALPSFKGRLLEDRVFDRVGEILDALHGRGIAAGDLHHRDVLLADDGSVFVVDLAMAFVLGEKPGVVRRTVFQRLREQDRIALARMRARFTGRSIDDAVAEIGGSAAAWHRRGRRFKAVVNRLRGKPAG